MHASTGSLQHAAVVCVPLICLKAFEGDSGWIEICLQNECISCFALVTLVLPGDILENNVMRMRD